MLAVNSFSDPFINKKITDMFQAPTTKDCSIKLKQVRQKLGG